MSKERLVIRAKQRSLDDMPAWAKCCPAMVQRCEETMQQEFTAIVQPFEAEATCPHCGRVKDALYRQTVGPIKTVIAVEMYEWDEGVTIA